MDGLMPEKWQRLSRTVRLECGIFKIEEKVFRSPRTGREHSFVSAEGTDWVNVIALTPSGEVVLVRQFRQSREILTLEIPGGMVDAGEEPAAAARRELLEETGYDGTPPVPLGAVDPNPAILNIHCHSFLMTDVRPVAEPRLDGSEDIEVVVVPLADIPDMIRKGDIAHALVITAFSLLELHRGGFATLRRP